jgi:hypothetical protein
MSLIDNGGFNRRWGIDNLEEFLYLSVWYCPKSVNLGVCHDKTCLLIAHPVCADVLRK